MNRRVGVYPGSFDPVHPGHVAFAEKALELCELEAVYFLPEEMPRNKPNVTALEHRVAMLERATAGNERLSVLCRKLGQFTVPDTLPLLREEFKGQNLTLILGSDVAKSLRFWNGIATLSECVSFAFGVREGCDPRTLDQAVLDIQNDHLEVVEYSIFEAPKAGMSSTQIREGTRNANELHPSVAAYLIEHSLYPHADTAASPTNV